MKRFFTIAILAVISCICVSAQNYKMKERAGIIKELEKAATWYRSGDSAKARDADYIISTVAEHQIKDPESRFYGSMSWWYKSPKLGLNMAGFIAHEMFVDLWNLQDRMSEQARKDFLRIAELIVLSEDRRFDEEPFPVARDEMEYSNAYCLSMQTVWLGAFRLQDKYRMAQAKNMWARYYQFYKFFGNGEFASAHYEEVDFTSILDMWRFCDDSVLKAQMKEVLDDIYISQTAITHPLLKLPIVGASRDYREVQKGGDASSPLFKAKLYEYEIPEKAVQLRDHRKYPFELEGKGGSGAPFTFKSYQTEDAGMGTMSGWGCYFYQNLHLVASAGRNENERASLFCPGTYNSVNGFTAQKGMTSLLVYNRKPTLWHLTSGKVKDISKYKDSIKPFGIGASDGFTVVENGKGKILLKVYGCDFYIFPFEAKDGKVIPCELQLLHRSETGAGISQSRKASFDEFMFPEEPDWFGAVVKVVKEGTKVKTPDVTFSEEGGICTIGCSSENLSIKVCETDAGASVALPEKNINMMPVLWMNQ